MDNTSGQGNAAAVPAEIDRWNWGAFFLNWIWGIGNNTYIAFLVFVPLVNMVMPFVLGAKGSAWAWRNKRWESVEHFKTIQRRWAAWGGIFWVCMVAAMVALFFWIMSLLKSSEAYQMAVAELETNREAALLIGKPMTAGFPTGEIKIDGSQGTAKLSFSVEGPLGRGTAYVEAEKNLGEWKVGRLVLAPEDGTGRRLDLKDGSSDSVRELGEEGV